MKKVDGSCYCQKIQFQLELTKPSEEYSPRLCDCDFCTKHGAAYLSDPSGSLRFYVQDLSCLRRYKQGGTRGLAEFLICENCGVLIGVIHAEGEHIWGAVNMRVVQREASFGPETTVSPKKLSDEEKVRRWKQAWFSNVKIIKAEAV